VESDIRIGHDLRRGLAAYAVLLISLLLTALAWYYVRQNVETQNRVQNGVRFDEAVQATQAAIERRTEAYFDAMLGARGLFYASDSVDREEWDSYVEGIEPASHFEGLQALSYAERVEPEEREAFDRRTRDEGLPDLQPDLVPGGERLAYFPIIYTGPLDEANNDMLSYDFYAEPAHREAMDQARDAGTPQATTMVYVLTDAPSGSRATFALRPGFMVYLPVYGEGEPQGTVAERRDALQGFVVGTFVMDGLLGEIFRGSFDPAIDFEVYDGEDPQSGTLLYDSDGIRRGKEEGGENAATSPLFYDSAGTLRAGERGDDTLFSRESRIEVAGRDWSLYFATLPEFEEEAASNLPIFVLVNGVAVSLLLFGITWMLVRSRTRAEHASRELEEANRKVETLYHSVEEELHVARRIQHALLPRELPELEGWEIAHYYQPAREVGGDFFNFLRLEDGRVGFVIGDVSGKGIAAAMVMANTQSVLRAVAQRGGSTPKQVLAEANEVLYAYMPPTNMFVTCFYAILDPQNGWLRYANAGHDLPYLRHHGEGVSELRVRGMPLGLMPGMDYEEKETTLKEGDSILFYSDGLVEAHDLRGEMFGFPRLGKLISVHDASSGKEMVNSLLEELYTFTGPNWEQEDDITLLTLRRSAT
jgi:serine phosphatase RsbU (regulator of sigma subunit)/CHASE1-domain containing sensor protein